MSDAEIDDGPGEEADAMDPTPSGVESGYAETAPPESSASEPLSTGDATVDAAVARLGELDAADLDGHPAIFEDIHAQLRSALDEPESGTGA